MLLVSFLNKQKQEQQEQQELGRCNQLDRNIGTKYGSLESNHSIKWAGFDERTGRVQKGNDVVNGTYVNVFIVVAGLQVPQERRFVQIAEWTSSRIINQSNQILIG